MAYKVIDGTVYKEVDVGVSINRAVEAARPYVDGIETCEQQIRQLELQIETYENAIQQTVVDSKIDIALVKLIAPDKASYLNIT